MITIHIIVVNCEIFSGIVIDEGFGQQMQYLKLIADNFLVYVCADCCCADAKHNADLTPWCYTELNLGPSFTL